MSNVQCGVTHAVCRLSLMAYVDWRRRAAVTCDILYASTEYIYAFSYFDQKLNKLPYLY